MAIQPTLFATDLFPGTALPALRPTIRRRKTGVVFESLSARRVLNRCRSPHLPFDWTINPYRGCELGCTYCYARYTHHFLELRDWRDFERRILVKTEAAQALERDLARRDLSGASIAIGTATDPYQPAERHFGITRSLLAVLQRAAGLHLSITTKSPLILRDLELLAALDRRHSVTVQITITTLDSGLARRIEQRAPDPQARLRTVRRLSAAGLDTKIFCMPLMPRVNDGERSLSPLLAAARDAGASDVVASPIFLPSAARARFFPWLISEFPALEELYRELFTRGSYLASQDRDDLMATFRHLRLLQGFPRRVAGRG
jgi:DNA repair photolyase